MPKQIERFYQELFVAIACTSSACDDDAVVIASQLIQELNTRALQGYSDHAKAGRKRAVAEANELHSQAGFHIAYVNGEQLCRTDSLLAVIIPVQLHPSPPNYEAYQVLTGSLMHQFTDALQGKNVLRVHSKAIFDMYLWERTPREKLFTDAEFSMAVKHALDKERRTLRSWDYRYNESKGNPIKVSTREGTTHVLPPSYEISCMEPAAFEDFVLTLLQCIGVSDAWVTPYTADGGVDVRGNLVVSETIKIPIAVQAKRHKGVLHSPIVREFRGSLNPGEIGIVVTTAEFSPGAIEEASRSGSVPIHLVSGTHLIRLVECLRSTGKSKHASD